LEKMDCRGVGEEQGVANPLSPTKNNNKINNKV
jgi:hypothetical protein